MFDLRWDFQYSLNSKIYYFMDVCFFRFCGFYGLTDQHNSCCPFFHRRKPLLRGNRYIFKCGCFPCGFLFFGQECRRCAQRYNTNFLSQPFGSQLTCLSSRVSIQQQQRQFPEPCAHKRRSAHYVIVNGRQCARRVCSRSHTSWPRRTHCWKCIARSFRKAIF